MSHLKSIDGPLSLPRPGEFGDQEHGYALLLNGLPDRRPDTLELIPWQTSFEEYTYFTREGTTLFSVEATIAGLFSEGLASVGVRTEDGTIRHGYVDTEGNWILRPQFANAENFSQGLAVAARVEGTRLDPSTGNRFILSGPSGYIDQTGTFVLEPRYHMAGDFKDGLAPVHLANPDKHKCDVGFIDKSGSFVISLEEARRVESFSEGLAAFAVSGATGLKWGFIDKTGRKVIEPQFDEARGFVEDRAAVRQRERWGLIDRADKFTIEPNYLGLTNLWEGKAVAAIDDMGKMMLN